MKVRIFHTILVGLARLLCMVLVVLTGCADSRESRLQQFLEKGNASLEQSNSEQAIYYFEQALKIDSCYADALNNIGTTHFNNRRLEEALRFYDQALTCDPGFVRAYFNRSNTFLALHDYQAALADIGRILKVKPDTGVAYFSRGLAYTEVERYNEAIESFKVAGRLDTALRFDALVNIAAVKIRMRQYDEAESDLRACMRERVDEPNIHNSLGLIAVEKKEFDKALVHANNALKLSPDQPYFLNNRGFIF